MKRKKAFKTVLIAMFSALLFAAGCGKEEEASPEKKETAGEVQEDTKETLESKDEADQAGGENAKETDETSEAEKEEPLPADYPGIPYAEINIKDYGTIRVKLEPGEAPITVKNFIELAESGFYDGLTFHRIIDGFMMQGGDPEGTGTGGAEKKITGEFELNGIKNNISHTKGTISMARSKDPNSASSQFFIVQSDSPALDGQYAGFGHVTEGIDIVDKICADAKPIDGNGTIPPGDQPVMESVKISYEQE